MTDPRQQELALKAVRARRLTDPLGALGQRRPGDRIEREARLRRGVFAFSVAAFAASFALVAATGAPPHDAAPAQPAGPAIAGDLAALAGGLPPQPAAAAAAPRADRRAGGGNARQRTDASRGAGEARAAAPDARQVQEAPARRVHARTQSS
ncbi:MAG: hypothetical protein ACKOWF_16935 [Chloroflexota bacterium]